MIHACGVCTGLSGVHLVSWCVQLQSELDAETAAQVQRRGLAPELVGDRQHSCRVRWRQQGTYRISDVHCIHASRAHWIIIIIQNDIYGAVIMAEPLREFTRSIWWMQTQRRGGRQPSDQANRLGLRVRQKVMASTVHIHHRHLLLLIPTANNNNNNIHICIAPYGRNFRGATIQLILIYRPTEGGRLSRPGHCSKGVQPVPKAVYRSGCRDKHNCPWWDSNLGPLTPQSGMLPYSIAFGSLALISGLFALDPFRPFFAIPHAIDYPPSYCCQCRKWNECHTP